MIQNPKEKLLSRKETAEFLGISSGTLAVWACEKRYGLKFLKIGRLVRYRLSDIWDFLEEQTRNKGGE